MKAELGSSVIVINLFFLEEILRKEEARETALYFQASREASLKPIACFEYQLLYIRKTYLKNG